MQLERCVIKEGREERKEKQIRGEGIDGGGREEVDRENRRKKLEGQNEGNKQHQNRR